MSETQKPKVDSPEAAWNVVVSASDCSNHPCDVPFTAGDIEKVYGADYGCNCGSWLTGTNCKDYCDSWGSALFRLKSGKYVIAEESADTSGHG